MPVPSYNNITFSLLFGGGARYCAGEDVTFVQDCLKSGLRVYKSPIIMSVMKQDSSTWFKGYDEKYFHDKGALLAANFPLLSKPGAFLQAYKGMRRSEFTYKKLLDLYLDGVREFLKKK